MNECDSQDLPMSTLRLATPEPERAAQQASGVSGAFSRCFDLGDPDEPFGRALLLDRHNALIKQIPVMYAVLLVNVATLAAMTSSSAPLLLRIGVPVAMSLLVFKRLLHFALNRRTAVSPRQAAVEQRQMILRSAFLSLGYAAWVMALIGSGSAAQATVAAMLAYVSALGCAFAMANLPWAARAAILLATVPIAAQMLALGDGLLAGLGVNLLLASVLALRMLNRHNANFVAGVRSRILLEQEGMRARAAEAAAAELARTDQLTGLCNRRGFLDALGELVESRSQAFALALLDLNGFKPINDRFGHPAGDEVLVEVGRRFGAILSRCSTVARFGGDEFAVLIPGVADNQDAEQIGRSICDSLAAPMLLRSGAVVRVSACCGIAIYLDQGSDVQSLLAQADAALYARKRARELPLRTRVG